MTRPELSTRLTRGRADLHPIPGRTVIVSRERTPGRADSVGCPGGVETGEGEMLAVVAHGFAEGGAGEEDTQAVGELEFVEGRDEVAGLVVEEGFAVALALVSILVFAMLSEIERRREFAIMAAMGTRLQMVAAFLWSETVVVTVTACLLAIVLGTALAVMLVTILTHIFDPAPDALALPWLFFGELGMALVAGAGAGDGGFGVGVARRSRRLSARAGHFCRPRGPARSAARWHPATRSS